MKNIFKLSILLLAVTLIFSSCSKNQLSSSTRDYEKLAKLSAEIEQNQIASIASNGKTEEIVAADKNQNTVAESGHQSGKSAVKANPVKTFKAIKEIKKMAKEQRLTPQQLEEDNSGNRSGLSQRMKLGILLGAVGLIIMFILGPLYWIGAILLVIGLVLIVMELLEM